MTTTPLLPNFFAGRWQTGTDPGTTLFDPVLGTPLVRVSNAGLDLAEGFAFAREQGGAALRALTYQQRAALLGGMVKVLQATAMPTTRLPPPTAAPSAKDSAVDIDGGIFTLGYYAKQGEALGDATCCWTANASAWAKTRCSRPSMC
jgi:3,4-dehydroadipyl-CoA semialdehyde dehydrogenase